jgi:hypothetical protein
MEPLYSDAIRFTEVLPLLSRDVQNVTGKQFSNVQLVLLEAAWNDTSVAHAAEKHAMNVTYLKNRAAPILWNILSEVFGEKVTKSNLHKILIARFFPEREVLLSDGRLSTFLKKMVGSPPICQNFVGRETDLHLLSDSITKNRCTLLSGSEGVGKTALVSKLFQGLQSFDHDFELVIWKNCISDNPADDIADLLHLFTLNGQQASSLLAVLRLRRVLICLDGVNRWFRAYREQATQTVEQFIKLEHPSSVIITSSEPLPFIERFRRGNLPTAAFQLQGLLFDESLDLLSLNGIDRKSGIALAKSFNGNPGLILLACEKIKDQYNGNIGSFLKAKTTFAWAIFRDFLDGLLLSSNSQISEQDCRLLNYLCSQKDPSLSRDKVIENYYKFSAISTYQIRESLDKLLSYSLVVVDKKDTNRILLPSFISFK